MSTFDWKQLPSGRARFAGSIRGWDETGHDTFAVEVEGVEVFGELKETFAANRNDFGITVLSFGYLDRGDVGMPITPGKKDIKTIDNAAVDAIKQVVTELIEAGVAEGSPSFLKQYGNSRFTGPITFSQGWVSRIRSDAGAGT